MKKVIILFISVFMLTFVSCGSDEVTEDANSNTEIPSDTEDLTLDSIKEEINYNPD